MKFIQKQITSSIYFRNYTFPTKKKKLQLFFDAVTDVKVVSKLLFFLKSSHERGHKYIY